MQLALFSNEVRYSSISRTGASAGQLTKMYLLAFLVVVTSLISYTTSVRHREPYYLPPRGSRVEKKYETTTTDFVIRNVYNDAIIFLYGRTPLIRRRPRRFVAGARITTGIDLDLQYGTMYDLAATALEDNGVVLQCILVFPSHETDKAQMIKTRLQLINGIRNRNCYMKFYEPDRTPRLWQMPTVPKRTFKAGFMPYWTYTDDFPYTYEESLDQVPYMLGRSHHWWRPIPRMAVQPNEGSVSSGLLN